MPCMDKDHAKVSRTLAAFPAPADRVCAFAQTLRLVLDEASDISTGDVIQVCLSYTAELVADRYSGSSR